MITKDDLNVLQMESFYTGHNRHVVAFKGKTYIVGSVNAPRDPKEFADWISYVPGDLALIYALGLASAQDTFVMEAVWDDREGNYIPKNECTSACSTGVCTKRVASNTTVGDQQLAYDMLLDHLNA